MIGAGGPDPAGWGPWAKAGSGFYAVFTFDAEDAGKRLIGGTWGSAIPTSVWKTQDDMAVACHGEIDNQAELCRELGLAAGTPLVDVLLSGWQRWSCGLLARLDGVFALMLRSGDEVLICRDPSGLRCLYCYTGRNGQITVATDLDGLFDLPGVRRRLARSSLHEYLRFLDIAAPNTLFEDVLAVEAGQVLRCSARGIERRPLPEGIADDSSPEEFAGVVDVLEERLQRSVRRHLEGAARPAAFLSGGIDSALLCALAARSRGDLTALTVGFQGAAFDEAPLAQHIASHLGLRHVVLRFPREAYLSALDRLAAHCGQPMADPATPATVLAFDHCRSHFDAVLDGTGADEAVGNMPPRHVRWAVAYADLLPRRARRALLQLVRVIPVLAGYGPLLDFDHPADTMTRWHGFTRLEIERLCGEPVSLAHTQFHRTFARFPRRAHFERYSALIDAMPCERLVQATLAAPAPIRYPYCSRDVDRTLRRMRWDFRFAPGEPKRILRAVLERQMPRSLWEVPKHGFNFPLREFLAGDDFMLVRRYLDRARWRETPILSADEVSDYARRFIVGDSRLAFRVWALVVLGAWAERHPERC